MKSFYHAVLARIKKKVNFLMPVQKIKGSLNMNLKCNSLDGTFNGKLLVLKTKCITCFCEVKKQHM